MDFSCGSYGIPHESKPADTRDRHGVFLSQDESTAAEEETVLPVSARDYDNADSWTISSLPEASRKEDDDSSLTTVTPLSCYSEDCYIGSSTLSEISSLLSWADGYLQQFDGYDIDSYDSRDGVIDLKEISHLIIDGILAEILSR